MLTKGSRGLANLNLTLDFENFDAYFFKAGEGLLRNIMIGRKE